MKNRIDTHQYCELPDLGAEISFQFNGNAFRLIQLTLLLQQFFFIRTNAAFPETSSITGLGVLMTSTARDMNHWLLQS
ncbi:MAG: hypothetical protein Ct9H300mP28_00210 [Pseudomonadota bacterium]|nr:MAG: hypothetical protein Ct9H300mP28_00210 [Pseudomonadota bacterium]